jgi:RNA polymerase sigma-70 factor (ECF subfamily)
MYRIARNVRADHFKKSRVEEPLAEDQADQIPESADASFWERLEQNLDRERLNALLERALLELPADKRELIVLSRYRQLPHVEVAAILEVDVGAVRVRLHRALRELETIFLKLAQESGENTLCNARNSKNTLPTI